MAETDEREFTVAEGLAYLLGAIGLQLTTTMMATWGALFYSPPAGGHRVIYVSIGMATAMMAAGQVVNAAAAPLVGFWSDVSKTRLGRRKPFLIFASVPMSVSFVLFWCPPVKGLSALNFLWGFSFGILFFWFLTVVMIPYIALMPEMARTTKGRVRIGTYNAVGMILGLVLGITSGTLISEIGVRSTALVFGAVSLVCFQVAGWGVRERHCQESADSFSSARDIFPQLASTLKNKPFLIFVAAVTIFNLGFYVIQIVLPDFNFVILGKNEDFVTLLFIPFLLVCLPLTFVVQLFVDKWNKKVVYAAGLLGFAVLFPFISVVGLVPYENLRIILLFAIVGIAGAPQAINYVMPGAMIGEIADYDEKTSGRRREAVYAGSMTFGITIAMAMGYAVRWLVYAPFGKFSIENKTPVLLIGAVTGAISLIGFLIFLKYPVLHVVRGEEKES